jgi:hypothetical protein
MAKPRTKTKKEVIVPTDDELILGEKIEEKIITVVDYLSKDAKYNVKIASNGREMKANGREIGTFLGMDKNARKQLQDGAAKVQILQRGRVEYEIEVIN